MVGQREDFSRALDRAKARAESLEAERSAVRRVLGQCESGEEAEHVDMMDGSEGTYADSLEEGVRFVCDRIRMLTEEGGDGGE